MSSKDKTTKIAVIKDNKDICRLIFREFESELFDLKIKCLGHKYTVKLYHLFRKVPEIIEVKNPENTGISYHPGYNSEKIRIHLKNEKPNEGELKYMDLLVDNILPPNTNQIFPLPLLKIEIPDTIIAEAKPYTAKKEHISIDIKNSNVIEIYMAHKNFNTPIFYKKNLNLILLNAIIPFEYLCTNSVLSDYQKIPNLFPISGVKEIAKFIDTLVGMKLMICHYLDNQYIKNQKKLILTFIENKYAEDIILNTLIKRYDKPICYDKSALLFKSPALRYGSASLKYLQTPTGDTNSTVLKDSIAEEIINNSKTSNDEKIELTKKAISSRIRLSNALADYHNMFEKAKKDLEEKANKFINAINLLHEQNIEEFACCINKDIITDVTLWHSFLPELHAQDIHILFAKYMGKCNCHLRRRIIYSQNFSSDSNSIEPTIQQNINSNLVDGPLDNLKYNHDWLVYNDMFEIDLLKQNLKQFLNTKDNFNDDIVFESMPKIISDNRNDIIHKLLLNGYICENIKEITIDTKTFEETFKAKDELLQRVYEDIIKTLKKYY